MKITSIQSAPQTQVLRPHLQPCLDQVLTILGFADAFVTDMSQISDFLEFGGSPTRRASQLSAWGRDLGFPVKPRDSIANVVMRFHEFHQSDISQQRKIWLKKTLKDLNDFEHRCRFKRIGKRNRYL